MQFVKDTHSSVKSQRVEFKKSRTVLQNSVRQKSRNKFGNSKFQKSIYRFQQHLTTTVKYKSSSGLKCTYFSEKKMLNKCKNDSSSHPNRYCFYTLLYTVFILRMLQFLCPYYTRHQQF